MTIPRLVIYRNTNAPSVRIRFKDLDLTGSLIEFVVTPAAASATTFSTDEGSVVLEDTDTTVWTFTQTFANSLSQGVSARLDVYRTLGGVKEKLGAYEIHVGGVGDYFGTDTTVVEVPGAQGVKGDAATIEVGSVSTLDPGEVAVVTNVGTPQAAVFNFSIPRGAPGTMESVVAGDGISVDDTDPANPVISSTAVVAAITPGLAIEINNADPVHPEVSIEPAPIVWNVADRTALKALDTTKYKVAFLKEDGRFGIFVWETGNYSTQVAADPQEGVYIKADGIAASSGAWTRKGEWKSVGAGPREFGAVGGGAANDDTAPVLAAPALMGIGGKTYIWPKDSHYLDDVMTIPAGATLKGATGKWKGYAGNRFDFYNQGSTIVCGPNGKIALSAGAAVEDLVIIREGITNPVTQAQAAAWTGRAIEGAGDNWSVDGVSVFGFQYGIYSASGQRMLIKNVQGDCSNGISISGNYDVGRIEGCHFWPFLSAYSEPGSPVTANRLRAGIGISLSDVSDWTKLTNNFTYGYLEGYRLSNVGAVQMFNNAADSSFSDIRVGSYGVRIISGASNIRMVGQQVASFDTGIGVNPGNAGDFVSIDGASVWACSGPGIWAGTGDVTIGSGTRIRANALHTSAVGLRANAPSGICRLSDTTFEAYAGASQIAVELGAALNRSNLQIDDASLRFINCGTSPIRGTGSLNLPTLASAGNVSLPGSGDTFVITGTTNIGNFVNNQWEGRVLNLIFTGALTLVNSVSLILTGSTNAVVTANSSMTLLRQGGAWIEIARSIK